MIVAAMAKSVMYPLHTWIPEAMNAPTPVSALLHSACYVKAGAYLIARMYSFGPWHVALGHGLLAIGCVTMLVGVVFAMAQTDLKRLLAFHTVSQLGYVVTGLALGTQSRGCRGAVLRHQSCAVQRHAVHVRRRSAASHRHARHHEARRPLFAHAGARPMSGWPPPPRSPACR